MRSRPRRTFALFVVMLLSTPAFPQAERARTASAPTVTVAVTATGVRFVAHGAVSRMRVEVLGADGTSLGASAFKPGSVFDWTPGANGAGPLADGDYQLVVTVMDAAGRLSLKQCAVAVRGGEASLLLGEAEPAGAAEAEKAAGAEPGTAMTLTAHDGETGQLVTTSGDLSFRGGDFFTGRDKELMRLSRDGSLEVSGSLHARGGIRFSDGTVLTSAGGRAGKGAKAGAAAAGDGGGGATPSVTVDRLAKFADAAGTTLVDSAVTETGGNVGIGTTSPAVTLDVAGAGRVGQLVLARGFAAVGKGGYLFGGRGGAGQIDSEGGFFMANDGTTGGVDDGPYFILRGNQFSRIPNQRGSIFVGAGTSIAGAQPGEGAVTFQTGGLNRLTVTAAGNVGIGTTTPQTALEVRTASGNYGFSHTDGTTTVSSYVGGSSSTAAGGWFGTSSNSPLHFFTNNGQPTMTLTGGTVGIGTFTPSSGFRLDTFGGVRSFGDSTHFVAQTTGGTNSWARFYMRSPNRSWFIGTSQNFNGDQFYLFDETSGQSRMTIQPDGGAIAFPFGNVGIGTFAPNTRLTLSGGAPWTSAGWTASVNLQNASALGWEANASGQRFGIGQSGGGLYFFRTNSAFGNTGSPANYDVQITDNGHLTQPRDKGGLVKAMIYVNADGTVARCYNSQMQDGGASLPPSGNTGCGFSVSQFGVGGDSNKETTVDFNFPVGLRFWSATIADIDEGVGISTRSVTNPGFNENIAVRVYFTNERTGLDIFRNFILIVY